MLHDPNTAKNLVFTCISHEKSKKGQKEEKRGRIKQNKCFWGLHPNAGRGFYSQNFFKSPS